MVALSNPAELADRLEAPRVRALHADSDKPSNGSGVSIGPTPASPSSGSPQATRGPRARADVRTRTQRARAWTGCRDVGLDGAVVRNSRWAMPALVRPSAIRARTSRSRGVSEGERVPATDRPSRSQRPPGRAPSRRRPRGAARQGNRRRRRRGPSTGSRSGRWRQAPRNGANSRCCDSSTMPRSACRSRSVRAARAPSSVGSGGMRMSTMTRSGWVLSTAAMSDGASPTFATTVWPASSSSRVRPSRNSAESSPITMRMGCSPRRWCQADWAGDRKRAAQGRDPIGHPGSLRLTRPALSIVAHLTRTRLSSARPATRCGWRWRA